MDQTPVINALIVAELMSEGERFVNIMRKAGFGVHADLVRDEASLRQKLQLQRWDILFQSTELQSLTHEKLCQILHDTNQDLCYIALEPVYSANASNTPTPERCVICPVDALDTSLKARRLINTVRHELEGLYARRALRKANTDLKELQHRYQLLLDSASDAICYLHDGLHVYTNAAYRSLFGFADPQAAVKHAFLDLVDEQDVEKVRTFLRNCGPAPDTQCVFLGITALNSRSRLSLSCANASFQNEPCQQVILQAVAGNVDEQQKTRTLQSHDLLTNLLNPKAFNNEIEAAIARAIYEHHSSLLFLLALTDFDDFLMMSGKSAGNLLLADVARIIKEALPPGTAIAHYGQGEFTVLQQATVEVGQEELLSTLQKQLNSKLGPVLPQGTSMQFSMGLAMVNELSPSAAVLIDRARHNLAVRNNSDSASTNIPTDAYSTAEQMFQRLEEAFLHEDFVLVYQPIVSLKEDGLERYEVRIRMQDHGHLIYPPRFLELANQHGLGEKIDRWVSAKSLQVLQERQSPALKLTINLTHNSIVSPGFLPWLRQQLQERRLQAEQIILQISELDIVSSPEQVASFCAQLRELGISLSITHFGCTITPLSSLPLSEAEYVKLDKSLLSGIGNDMAQREKLNATVNSLHAVGLLVIAPMIDQIDLLALLWQANVNFVQGNCLQKPSADMDFSFVQDEEITLNSFH